MEFEQDYLMRMIKQAVKALISFLLGKDNPLYELPLEERYEASEGLYHELIDLVNEGKINEAENLLYERLEQADRQDVCDAIMFYDYLNELEDDYLEAHDYSREEIRLGLKMVAAKLGMESLVDVLAGE